MKTYCNPLKIEQIKSGRIVDTNINKQNPRDFNDYRSIADPSVIYDNGKWIMFPSYNMAYVSEDFINWEFHDVGIPNVTFSPAVVKFRDKWYINLHSQREIYVADNPLGPYKVCGLLTYANGEPMQGVPDACFLADNDRLYFYWFQDRLPKEGEEAEFVSGTLGAELNPDKPWQLITDPVWLNEFNPNEKWQRTGEHNENKRLGWIEGQWMLKINNAYYLLHSGSGTQYSSYANGVAISTEGPLSGFKAQVKNSPLTEKRTGLIRGAGHGSLCEGPNNTYWVFYTSLFNFNHKLERRVCMDRVYIDSNGELYCPRTTETPQLAPLLTSGNEESKDLGLLPVTCMRNVFASSYIVGREPIYAVDESWLTWWQPKDDDKEKCITVPLESNTAFIISSIRIIWRDIGMDYLDGVIPGPIQYVVEYSDTKKDNYNWKTLIDASKNDKDLCVDYIEVEPTRAYALRLKIVGAPKGISVGLCNFTAFGECE